LLLAELAARRRSKKTRAHRHVRWQYVAAI
jgi:hypothetical protein